MEISEVINYLAFNRNTNLVYEAIETLNDFLEKSENSELCLYDENGNIFKPKGKINFLVTQITKEENKK